MTHEHVKKKCLNAKGKKRGMSTFEKHMFKNDSRLLKFIPAEKITQRSLKTNFDAV